MIWKKSHTSGTCSSETFGKNIHYCRGQDVAAMSLNWTDYSKLCTWVVKTGVRKKKKFFLIVLLVTAAPGTG